MMFKKRIWHETKIGGRIVKYTYVSEDEFKYWGLYPLYAAILGAVMGSVAGIAIVLWGG